MKYFFDIDGVLRNLHITMGIPYSPEWYDPVFIEAFARMVDENPEKLFKNAAKFSDMCDAVTRLINTGNEVIFLTGSPSRYKDYTQAFIRAAIPNHLEHVIIHVDSMEDKLDYLKMNPEFVLVDDYPFYYKSEKFKEVSHQIYIVPRKWNLQEAHNYHGLAVLDGADNLVFKTE